MATSRTATLAATFVALVGLAGCASMRDDRSTSLASPPRSQPTVQQDTAYMERVEQQARIRGIGVTWVNPPIKRIRVATTPR